LDLDSYLRDATVEWRRGTISWRAFEDASKLAEADPELKRVQQHVVVLVHGIRDYALWQNSIRGTLEDWGFKVEPTNYGRINLLKFLAPVPWFQRRAIRQIWEQVQMIRQTNESHMISFVAHSFGTLVVSQILAQEFSFKAHRLIFCGSVVPYGFKFQQIQGRYTSPILNEVGTRDVWPAIAESVTFGYGSGGTFGFRKPPFRDRWHNGARHGYFLNAEFCKRFWVPYLIDGRIVEDKRELESPQSWVNFLSIFKIKYILVGALLVLGIIFLQRIIL